MRFVLVPILFFVAFWVLGVASVAKQKKKQNVTKKAPNTYIVNKPNIKDSSSIQIKHKGTSSLSQNEMFKDDRQNDWLAKQMKEESRIKRRDMLDLGAAHDRNCAAEQIRSEHKKVHINKRGVL